LLPPLTSERKHMPAMIGKSMPEETLEPRLFVKSSMHGAERVSSSDNLMDWLHILHLLP
jgi:hypothetical protein